MTVFSPAAFRARYGLEPPDTRRGLLFAAVEIRVADLDRADRLCRPDRRTPRGAHRRPALAGLRRRALFPEG